MFLRVFIFINVLFSANAMAAVGKGHVSGKITNITSISSGLLVRINANEVPEHCTSGRVWMQIKQENTAMTSLTLTAWTLKRGVTVYTSADSSGYCRVIQVDPYEN
ncbi:hypothetical protein WNY97_06545 [Pseudoalteromonas fuliginea]|uniref:hypothetical protein n=1 Tax=Pseudoalteromonas TaxID=53246 RepID=UPI0002315E8C|nr:hypothetical protein [Pseudoalteromonas sp. BSi20495]GAA78334.1 hypothetical protein P20495_0825 [Pseudoalteromonas sp. BSi20495]